MPPVRVPAECLLARVGRISELAGQVKVDLRNEDT
jgi:hypothetical protein